MKRLRRIVHRAVVMGLLICACGSRLAVADGTQTVTVESRTITVRIDRPFDKVYEFLVDPANWNQWAFGLSRNIRRSQDGWIADSDAGVARVQFTGNSYNVKPLTFVHSTRSPLYTGMEEVAAANPDYMISTEKSDARWRLTWSWEERNPAAWKLAEKKWRGVVTLETLQTLEAFHRIAP